MFYCIVNFMFDMNPTNRATLEDIEEWLQPVLKKLNIKEPKIEISGNSEKGDGYLGDIVFVKVHGKTEKKENKVYNFVLKCGKKSAELRKVMPIKSAFENEIYFYEEILPTFLEFQKEKGIKEPFNNVPKCYDTLILENTEILILDDMKSLDYKLWNRKKPMNKEHIRLVIKTYGKLHAISFALRDQKPEVFNKLTSKLMDIFKIMSDTSPTSRDVKIFRDVINVAKEKQYFDIVEKATILQEEVFELNYLTDPTDPYAVILHGDCWNNNFMFKYTSDQNTQLADVCLLDFQNSRLASPVYDLSYFLFTCISDEDVINFDQIINIYYDSFCNFARQLGSEPEKMFPFDKLLLQWKKFSKFGLCMMPLLIRICLSEEDEVADVTEAAESGIKFSDAFTYSVRNVHGYGKRRRGLYQ